MAYATSGQVILQCTGVAVYVDSREVHFIPEADGEIGFSRPFLGFITDLSCALHDLEIQEDELQRKD